ncbi:hypothetical protein SAMN05421841_3811 [Chryseobacterium wanjuense]|uniref:Uncharacterized protein n=1 Tax=Chryseobacterium wanjuense TaxID=356305 RepID=A0A1I0S1I1_9FLAO|nr:hypothetical protein SAMN05421841_3811 [Chryseobacterium wanjuense]
MVNCILLIFSKLNLKCVIAVMVLFSGGYRFAVEN